MRLFASITSISYPLPGRAERTLPDKIFTVGDFGQQWVFYKEYMGRSENVD